MGSRGIRYRVQDWSTWSGPAPSGCEASGGAVAVDVSFTRVAAATSVRGDDDDDDAVPARRELFDAADWRGRRPRAADLASLVCQA